MTANSDIRFWDHIAPRYAKMPISNQEAYEATLDRVKSHLSATDRVVELGCGTGSTALILAPHIARYTASDAAAGMIAIAEDKRAAAGQTNLHLRQAGIDAAAFADAPCDAVLAFNLLHLVPDLDAALAEIAAMLPAGGRFISKTPCLNEKALLRLISWTLVPAMQLVGRAPRLRRLDIATLDRALDRAGFDTVETGLYPASTASHFIVAQKR